LARHRHRPLWTLWDTAQPAAATSDRFFRCGLINTGECPLMTPMAEMERTLSDVCELPFATMLL
jgi:hypothetical protein